MEYKYDLGIIGGMGPEATIEIYQRIIQNTLAKCDQEHLRICILNKSDIPDRSSSILNNSNLPLDYINDAINDLILLKTKAFIIACNTAHYYASGFKNLDKIKFYSLIDEALIYLNKNYQNYSICVLATDGTKIAKVYETSKEKKDLNIIYPSLDLQKEVMKVIFDTKEGKDKKVILNNLNKIILNVASQNCDKKVLFVLACTELSIYKELLNSECVIVDAMEVLVKKILNELSSCTK